MESKLKEKQYNDQENSVRDSGGSKETLQDTTNYLPYILAYTIGIMLVPDRTLYVMYAVLPLEIIRYHRLVKLVPKQSWVLLPLAIINPFLYVAITLMKPWYDHKLEEHSALSTLDKTAFKLMGGKCNARYVDKPDFRAARVTELEALEHKVDIMRGITSSERMKVVYATMLVALPSFALKGQDGLLFAVIIAAVYWLVSMSGVNKPSEGFRRGSAVKAVGQEGVYIIELRAFSGTHTMGVGYLKDGTFTTRWHVTDGDDIELNGSTLTPSYENQAADIICYGGVPNMAVVSDGDRIVVALANSRSTSLRLYETVATVQNGYVLFKGVVSTNGGSGSPYFLIRSEKAEGSTEEHITYEYAGCIGWSYQEPEDKRINQHVEVTKNIGFGNYQGNLPSQDFVQYISHPGSGKTRNVIPQLVQQGLAKYGRVNLVGPTRVVASEIYRALQEDFMGDVSLKISGSPKGPKIAPIMVTSHATALHMIISQQYEVSRPALWVMDEAHFSNTASQCLKHYLRHVFRNNHRKGGLIELTATAYSVHDQIFRNANGSNYHIQDTLLSKEQMLKNMLTDDRKMIIFASSVSGQGPTSIESLTRHLKGKKVISIHRKNFATNYPIVKKGEHQVILTTNISECGANYDADVVYDFQEQPTPTVMSYDDIISIKTTSKPILRSQLVQRRGRIGRNREGEYIAPKAMIELPDIDLNRAEDMDVAIFCEAMGIDILDPHISLEPDDKRRLTQAQVISWVSGRTESLSSPLTHGMLTRSSGEPKSISDMKRTIDEWYATSGFTIEMEPAKCRDIAVLWDDRDAVIFNRFLVIAMPNQTEAKTTAEMNTLANKLFLSVGRSLNPFTWTTIEDIQEVDLPEEIPKRVRKGSSSNNDSADAEDEDEDVGN